MYRISHPYLGDDEMEFDSYDDALEWIQEEEIIYYQEAIEYLSENDPSLCLSIEYAIELGVTIEKINSELLATIHLQESLAQAIEEVENA